MTTLTIFTINITNITIKITTTSTTVTTGRHIIVLKETRTRPITLPDHHTQLMWIMVMLIPTQEEKEEDWEKYATEKELYNMIRVIQRKEIIIYYRMKGKRNERRIREETGMVNKYK